MKTAKRAISRLFVPAIAIMALVPACSMDEALERPASAEASRAIGFHTTGTKIRESRVTDLTVSNLTNFQVTAVEHTPHTVIQGLVNKTVTLNGSNWEYAPLVPWPDAGTVDFYAATVNDATQGTAPVISQTQGVAGAKLTYSVPTDGADQKDLLVAVNENFAIPSSSAERVLLNFKHALSQVCLKVVNIGAQYDILIQEVELVNLYPEGTLDMNNTNIPKTGAYTVTGPIWTPTGSTAADFVNITGVLPSGGVKTVGNFPLATAAPTAADYTDVLGAGTAPNTNALMVLPQTTTLGQSVTNPTGAIDANFYLRIKATVDGVTPQPTAKDFYVAIGVPDPNDATKQIAITFEPGKKYTIMVQMSSEQNFSLNNILFGTVTIDGWATPADINGQLGPSGVAKGAVLPACDRWLMAVVTNVDGQGRPTQVLAQIGAIPDATVSGYDTYYNSYYADWASALTAFQNSGAFPSTVTKFSEPITTAFDDLTALDRYLSAFGLTKDENNLYQAIRVVAAKGSRNRIQLWNSAGTNTAITGVAEDCAGLPLIEWMDY